MENSNVEKIVKTNYDFVDEKAKTSKTRICKPTKTNMCKARMKKENNI